MPYVFVANENKKWYNQIDETGKSRVIGVIIWLSLERLHRLI